MPKPKTSDRKILPDDLPRIVQLFKDHNTQTDIGNEYGVDHSTIRYYLCRLGIIVKGKRYWRQSLKKVSPISVCSTEVQKIEVKVMPEEICSCKSYDEILEEAKKRDRRSLIHIIAGKCQHKCTTIEGGGI